MTWKKAIADLGNSIKPKKAKKQPSIALFDVVPSFSNNYNGPVKPLNDKIQLTIALTDPDAPSAQDPEWSQICHWIATDVQLSPAASNIDADEDEDEDEDGDGRSTTASSKHKHPSSPSLTEIIPYKAPGPPPSTGSHRYVFVALAPLNATTEKLNLSVPKDRKRWGFEGERAGLREWARENGLGVVGKFLFPCLALPCLAFVLLFSVLLFRFCSGGFVILDADMSFFFRSKLRVFEEQEAVRCFFPSPILHGARQITHIVNSKTHTCTRRSRHRRPGERMSSTEALGLLEMDGAGTGDLLPRTYLPLGDNNAKGTK